MDLPPVPNFNPANFARLVGLQRELPAPPRRRSGRPLPPPPQTRSTPRPKQLSPLSFQPSRLPPILENISTLPSELVEKIIADNLSVNQIEQFCQTNSWFAEVCQSEHLWKALVKRDFYADELEIVDTWKSFYKLLSRNLYTATYSRSTVVHSEVFTTLDDAIHYIIRQIIIDGFLFKLANQLGLIPSYAQLFPRNYDPVSITNLSTERFRDVIERLRQNNDQTIISQIKLAEEFMFSVIKNKYQNDVLEIPLGESIIRISISSSIITPIIKNQRQYYIFQLNTESSMLYTFAFPDRFSDYVINTWLHDGYAMSIENGSAVFRLPDPTKTITLHPLSDQDIPHFVSYMRKVFL